MALRIDPPRLRITASGGLASHTLINNSENRLAFKIKSSNNNNYRLKPVFGFIEPKSSTTFEIIRTDGPPKEDKLVIQYLEAPAEIDNAATHFKNKTAEGEINLPISAVIKL